MNKIKNIREKIDRLDKKILRTLQERLLLSEQIGKVKKKEGEKIYQPKREKEITEKLTKNGEKYNLDPKFVSKLFKLIIKESRKCQKRGFDKKSEI